MINVNWTKIKPFEKKSFAICAMLFLGISGIVFTVLNFVVSPVLPILKIVASVLLAVVCAFYIHIESRMLQIYMLQGIVDISLLISAFVGNKGLIITFFVLMIVAVLASCVLTLYSQKQVCTDTEYFSPEPERKNIYANKSVMMFAPHEDDEINIYGGIIEQYVANGSDVKIVFYTNGDVYGLGKLRIKEAVNVAKFYKIPEENVIFMGYSDSICDKNAKHIYNCQPEERLTSVKGYRKAYGTASHKSYSDKPFTRQNIVDDFKSIINENRPDVLYCCDYDSHADHRAIGLFFEEALGDILKSDPFYNPKVYKGFAYSLAWMGKLDYYSLNSKSTHQWIVNEYMVENNVYKWSDRLRLPVAADSLSHVMQNASSYQAMMLYSSQTATDHANGILNNDKVFWERRCDSVLYNAKITATSGNPKRLTEFKLNDSRDIKNQSIIPCSNAWVADENDENRAVMLQLPEERDISQLSIYTSPIVSDRITNAIVKIGNKQFETGELEMGCNKFVFSPIKADKLAIMIDSFEGVPVILKLEAFSTPDSTDIQVVKLVNSEDDFCYDYYINSSGTEEFTIYKYPIDASDEFYVDATGQIECQYENGVVTVHCEEGEEGRITVRSKIDPSVYDEVRISNPSEKQRAEIKKKQNMEQKLWSFPMQWDYYIGLLRRLLIYR